MKECQCDPDNMRFLLKEFVSEGLDEGIFKLKSTVGELEDFIQDWIFEHIELNNDEILYD